jgi:hypothetical protein
MASLRASQLLTLVELDQVMLQAAQLLTLLEIGLDRGDFPAYLQLDSNGFHNVAAVRDIAGPGLTTTAIDLSTREDLTRARVFAPGKQDGGEVAFDIVFDPDLASHSGAAQGGLLHALNNRTREHWRLLFDLDGSNAMEFHGAVVAFRVKAPQADVLSADLTIKLDGTITRT